MPTSDSLAHKGFFPSVLIITRNYPPLIGGMEKLIWHLSDELTKLCRVNVIAPKGAQSLAPDEVRVREIPLRPLWLFFIASFWGGLKIGILTKPSLVIAGSGLTAPLAWISARICGAKAIVYVHGLDIVAPNLLYRTLWRPFLKRMDHVIANSHATAELAKNAGVRNSQISIIHPGVSLPNLSILKKQQIVRREFRARYQLGDGPVLLSVGRLNERKGIAEFVKDVLPLICDELPDAKLVIVGDTPKQSLHTRTQSQLQIKNIAQEAGVGKNILFLGAIDDNELSAAYLSTDVHVFPIRQIPDDPEGFGMVAIEAASHCLPTVAYQTGGVTDAVENNTSGMLVTSGDAKAFAAATIHQYHQPPSCRSMQNFAKQFSWNCFGDRVRDLVIRTVKKQ